MDADKALKEALDGLNKQMESLKTKTGGFGEMFDNLKKMGDVLEKKTTQHGSISLLNGRVIIEMPHDKAVEFYKQYQ